MEQSLLFGFAVRVAIRYFCMILLSYSFYCGKFIRFGRRWNSKKGEDIPNNKYSQIPDPTLVGEMERGTKHSL